MPSAALQALVPNVDNAVIIDYPVDNIVNNETSEINVFNRPSMAFIIEAHNLPDLKWAMKQAVRKAACRSYALQVRKVIILSRISFVFLRVVLCIINRKTYFHTS